MSNFLTLVLTTITVFVVQQLCLFVKDKLNIRYQKKKNKKPERKRKG